MSNITVAIIGSIISSIIVIMILSFLFSWPVYMLWNGCLVGAITGINQVTWLQAWGISFLSSMLFKSDYKSSKN